MTKSTENKQIAEILYTEYKTASDHARQEEILKSFIETISKKGLTSRFANIIEQLEILENKDSGTVSAKITTKEKLPPHLLSEIKKFIEKKYDAKKVTVDERVDEKVLGGMKIRIDDDVFDATLARSLQTLKNALSV